jgi:hypothetical protein
MVRPVPRVTVLMVSSEEPAVLRDYVAKHASSAQQGYVADAPESQATMKMKSGPYAFSWTATA